jgi:hypothetical protein
MNTYELAYLVYRDLGQPPNNNDLLPLSTPTVTGGPTVYAALNLGYKVFSERTQCFTRTHTVNATSGTAIYSKPQDILNKNLRYVTYDALYLRETTIEAEDSREVDWRVTASGTPLKWMWNDARYLRFFPTPSFLSGTHPIVWEQYIVPLSIGGGIASITRAENVVTATTNQAHKLAVGDTVQVYGVTDGLTTHFDTTAKVLTAVTSTTLTYAHTGDAGSGTASTGMIGYDGGVLPLYLSGDIPEMAEEYHQALVDFAVWTLGSGYLSEQVNPAKLEAAAANFEKKVADYLEKVA